MDYAPIVFKEPCTCTTVQVYLYMYSCTCTVVHVQVYMYTCTCTVVYLYCLSFLRINVHNSSKLELVVGNEIIRKNENYRYVIAASIPLRDKMVTPLMIINTILTHFSTPSSMYLTHY